ncbi:hypothetical protein ACLBWH_00255 [Sphingomonas sp. M6A6_1c]
MKRRWDIVLPGVGSVALTLVVRLWPAVPAPFSATGYLAGLQSLYAILGGFFVAALTLLSTANSEALLQPLGGTPRTTYGNETAPLERRRFLCLLFGYLSFSCFGLYGLGFSANMLAPGLRILVHPDVRFWIGSAFILVYNFWLSHLFIATMIGLYYFTDKVQRADPTLIRDAVPAD